MKHKLYNGTTIEIPDNEYNKGILKAIKFISKQEGWEESEDHYIKLFYKDIIIEELQSEENLLKALNESTEKQLEALRKYDKGFNK